MRLQAITGRHRGTISRVLKRHGVSGRRRGQRQRSGALSGASPGRSCRSMPTAPRSSWRPATASPAIATSAGAGSVSARRSDNAKRYTGLTFAETLGELGARHIRIPPYTPRWNGNAAGGRPITRVQQVRTQDN
jgi:hypothetical protein